MSAASSAPQTYWTDYGMGAAFGIHLGAGRETAPGTWTSCLQQLPLVLAFGVRGQDEQVVIDLQADLERQGEEGHSMSSARRRLGCERPSSFEGLCSSCDAALCWAGSGRDCGFSSAASMAFRSTSRDGSSNRKTACRSSGTEESSFVVVDSDPFSKAANVTAEIAVAGISVFRKQVEGRRIQETVLRLCRTAGTITSGSNRYSDGGTKDTESSMMLMTARPG